MKLDASDPPSMRLHTARPELIEQIEWLLPKLPPARLFAIRGEADYYGASYEIASAVGLNEAPYSDATWRHGWTIRPLTSPKSITGYGPSDRVHLVVDETQAEFVRGGGYPNAFGVGLPILYAPVPTVSRRPRSLIVAPMHSVPEVTPDADQKKNELEYAHYLNKLRDRFDCICACVHSNCLKTGLWVNTFDESGIPWVVGGVTNDSHSLRRVRTLFASFDVLMTNQLGSAIPYAAWQGAKVCIAGPLASLPSVEAFAQHPHYKKHPGDLEGLALRHPDRMRELLPFLFVEPDLAERPLAWAEREIGVANTVRHEDIARLLGWRFVEGDPAWEGVDRAMAMRTFGWLPPAIGTVDALDRIGQFLANESVSGSQAVDHLRTQRRNAKRLVKISKAAERADGEVRAIKSSWVWRLLGKPLFSVEKRMRPGLRGQSAAVNVTGGKEDADEAED